MELVAYSYKQVDLPDGEYEGIIRKDNRPFCLILIDRDNKVSFGFETVRDIVLSKGLCKVKVYKNRAAIYI
jgi:hypothetical protein